MQKIDRDTDGIIEKFVFSVWCVDDFEIMISEILIFR